MIAHFTLSAAFFRGIVSVYKRYDFMPEMREAQATMEEFVLATVQQGEKIVD